MSTKVGALLHNGLTASRVYYLDGSKESATIDITKGAGNNIIIGTSAADNSAANVTIFGESATVGASGARAVVVGYSATANAPEAVIIGDAATDGNSGNTACVVIGNAAQITGTTSVGSVAIGDSARVDSDEAIAIGQAARASDNDAIAIGDAAHASNSFAITIGNNGVASGQESISIGNGADATANQAIRIGTIGNVSSANSIGIGYSVNVSGTQSICIGRSFTLASDESVVIGADCSINGTSDNLVVIGNDTFVDSGSNQVSVGYGNFVDDSDTVLVGNSISSDSPFEVAIGNYIYVGGDYAIAIGHNVDAFDTSSDYSITIGANGWMTAESHVGIGYYVYPSNDYDTCLGAWSYTGDFGATGVTCIGAGATIVDNSVCQLQIGPNSQTLLVTDASAYTNLETVTGGTSGATGTVIARNFSSSRPEYLTVELDGATQFQNEVINGGTSLEAQSATFVTTPTVISTVRFNLGTEEIEHLNPYQYAEMQSFEGGMRINYDIETSGVTLTDDQTHVEATTASVTHNLWASPTTGDYINILNSSAGSITVSGNGNNIDGSASITVAAGLSVTLAYNGTQWRDIGVRPNTGAASGETAKAWIEFDGDSGGSPSVLDSFNVTSITDNGTGDYTINWDTDFAGTSYAWTGSGEATTTGSTGFGLLVSQPNGGTKTGASLQINTHNLYPDGGVGPGVSFAITDPDSVCVVAFGDQ